MSNQISNKDLLETLTQIKDNHLNHIQRNTSRTNWLLGLIAFAVFVSPLIDMLMK